jgi:hypothetical protein
MGYTTPFLAAALADLEEQVVAESRALAEKTRPYVAGGAMLDETWLMAEPALVTPTFHLKPYRPRFIAVDDLSIADSSAGLVQEVLGRLHLADRVRVINADLHECAALLPPDFLPIDFAWVDAWECLYFFDRFWDTIDPEGGLIVMHYLMTYPEGEAILRYIGEFQRSHPGELEMMNLLESHKLAQNSITVLRRISGAKERRYAGAGSQVRYTDTLRQDAAAHVALIADE